MGAINGTELYIEGKSYFVGRHSLFSCVWQYNLPECRFFSAATQIQLPRFDINELFEAIGRYEQITFFPAVPTLITAVVNNPKIKELNIASKIGVFNSGGAPMPAELIKR